MFSLKFRIKTNSFSALLCDMSKYSQNHYILKHRTVFWPLFRQVLRPLCSNQPKQLHKRASVVPSFLRCARFFPSSSREKEIFFASHLKQFAFCCCFCFVLHIKWLIHSFISSFFFLNKNSAH